MKLFIVSLSFLFLSAGSQCQTYINDVSVIDVVNQKILVHQSVKIVGEKIESVRPYIKNKFLKALK